MVLLTFVYTGCFRDLVCGSWASEGGGQLRSFLVLHEHIPRLCSDDSDIAEGQIDPDSTLPCIPPSLADESDVNRATKVDKRRQSIRFPGAHISEESKPENTHHHETLAGNDRKESQNILVDWVTPKFSIPLIGREWLVLLVYSRLYKKTNLDLSSFEASTRRVQLTCMEQSKSRQAPPIHTLSRCSHL